jgi:alpha-ketoglutarate-dependent taurine dioxygenase
VRTHRAWITDSLAEHGALLFRGFNVAHAAALNAFCEAARFELMDYRRGITPRHVVDERVYTATDAPAAAVLPLHNEMSYTSVYPAAVAFCCEIAPTRGGQTPIADMTRVAERLPAQLIDCFESRGICYKQRVPSGNSRTRGKSWQQMFETDDREEVEAACAEQGVEFSWAGDELQLQSVRPAVLTHPRTGCRVWFNQAHIFHPSYSSELLHDRRWLLWLVLRAAESLKEIFPSRHRGYRFDCCYGDGTPIERATIGQVRRVLWEEATIFGWQRGDLLLLDNLRIAHGRQPFRGDRRILAALIAVTTPDAKSGSPSDPHPDRHPAIRA